MKVVFILLWIGTLSLWATDVHSQNATIHINDYRDLTIERFIREVESQTNYLFVYSKSEVNTNEQVSLPAQEVSVKNALDRISASAKLSYLYDNDYIVLTKRELVSESASAAGVQGIVITGTITDETGETMPGVNIQVKGAMTGTVSDISGRYTINVPNADAVLVFSFIGYASQEMVVGAQRNISVTMVEETQEIDEVVVVGYGVQKKVNLAGAVGTIKSDVLEGHAVTNVQELLQGKTPGLNVTKSSGQPGSGASLNIRGTNTIGSSSGVLVMIDGVPGNIYTVNPNDVESISVLKDASAAIYGARAANGVILITTKAGTDKKELQVSVNSSVGIQYPQHFIDFVGAVDFMNLYNLARRNEGATPIYSDSDIDRYRNGTAKEFIWYREVLNKNQLISNNHISLAGKTKVLKYNISGAYDYDSGMVDKNDYNRYIFKPDMTFTPTHWLSVRANVQYTETHLKAPQGGAESYLVAATRISPVTPVYTAKGQFTAGDSQGGNPIGQLEQAGTNNDKYKEMLSIFTATVTPIKNWNIRPMFSLYTVDRKRHNYTKPYQLYNEDGTIAKQSQLAIQTLTDVENFEKTRILQLTSDYMFTLANDHNFTVMAGYSQEYNYNDGFWASRKNPAFEDIYELNIYQEAKDNGSSVDDVPPGQSSMESVFGRLTYDYRGKYLFEATLRADGSSRFTEGNRWGVFPSFFAGWNVHHESFLEGNPILSRLKVRGSWGIVGDALKVGRYETRNLLSFNSKGYAFNGSLIPTAWSAASFDPNITWEQAEQANVGAEIGFWSNRIALEFDFFNYIRKDILYKAPVPVEYGLTAPYINALKMRNRGFEFLISYNDQISDVKFGVDFNMNFSKNKVLDLYGTGPWIESNTYTDVGTQYQMKYGYEAIGLFQENDPDLSKQSGAKPGNIKYKDQIAEGANAPDGKIDGNDRVILSEKVPIRLGFNLHAEYKGFDLSANFYGRLNNERYISGYEGWAFYLTNNARPMHMDTWTPENPNASYPRVTTNMTGNDTYYSSYWLRKANYLKIQSMQLGYTIPTNWKESIGIDRLRVYLAAQNLAIFSDYVGFDPEGGYYPLPRTFSFGIQLQF